MKTKFLAPVLVLVLAFGFFACSNPSGSDGGAGTTPSAGSTIISIDTIPGVTPPAFGETPVTAIAETAQYTGTVTWSTSPVTFAANTVYTATITLAVKSGYTLQGVAKDFFNIAGAASVNNSANSRVVTAVFPATGSVPSTSISIKTITGVTVPVTSESPVTVIDETVQFTGIVIWSPNDTVFKASTEYTAEIHLTAKPGYTLQGVAANFFTVTGATAMSNTADSGVITAVFPATEAPLYFSGSGTSGNPYQIGTAGQLAKLADLVNAGNTDYNSAFYILTANIDLSSYGSGFNGGKGWIPVGTNSSQFKGNLDGNSKKITGLYINNANLDYAGLFGEIYIGSVKNLALENVNISGAHNYVGGVAGYLYGGSIRNCYTTGIIKGNDNIGGIAGYNNNSRIENCYSAATINGNYYIGGIVGYIGAGSISACYSIGAISGNYIIGGIAGLFAAGSITNSVALNPSIKAGSTAGRITGDILSSSSGTLDNNAGWHSIENNAGYTTWSSPGLTAKDGADITMSAIQADGSLGSRFTSAGGWTTANGQLPGLFGSTAAMPAYLVPAFTGEGTSASPYLINNAADLAKLGELVNAGNAVYNGAAYNLTADIDLSSYQSGAGWVPIGYSDSNSFHGAFDGTHKTISNLKINYTGTGYTYAGLFGYVYGGAINYLNVNTAITSSTSYTGGIAGRIDNNATIYTCSVTGTVQSTATNPLYPAGTGGLVGSAGYTAQCTIIYSWSTATVTGSGGDTSTGGAVGFAGGSTITNCYATGAVKSSSYNVGGFAGQLRGTTTLKGCYATGTVDGTNNIGGLVGFIRDGVTVNSCYASGNVTGSVNYAGGVVGNSSSCTISNCVALNQNVAGTGANNGRVAGGIAATTLDNNAAWAGILNKAGATTWGSKAVDTIDGADISAATIKADGTLGGRTTTTNGWNVLNGYLPYLNSSMVAIPAYIN